MIARIWHGKTEIQKKDEYIELIKKLAIPDYTKINGNLGFTFLVRTENDTAHFQLITYWTNIDAIKQFAGEDFEKAKYYPEDVNFLLEYEEKVSHYEVFAME